MDCSRTARTWGPVPTGGHKHTEKASLGQARGSLQVVGGLVEEEGLAIITLLISYYSSKLPLMAH